MFPFFFILYSSEAVGEGKNTGKKKDKQQVGSGDQRQALVTSIPGANDIKE